MLLVLIAKFKLIYQGSCLQGNLATTFLAKNIYCSLFSLRGVWIGLFFSNRLRCNAAAPPKGTVVYLRPWVTHQFMSIQVRPSWRSCQGDWEPSQMGSLTHRAMGRKHFGIWVACFELGKEASSSQPASQVRVNIDCGWWDDHPGCFGKSPTISENCLIKQVKE